MRRKYKRRTRRGYGKKLNRFGNPIHNGNPKCSCFKCIKTPSPSPSPSPKKPSKTKKRSRKEITKKSSTPRKSARKSPPRKSARKSARKSPPRKSARKSPPRKSANKSAKRSPPKKIKDLKKYQKLRKCIKKYRRALIQSDYMKKIHGGLRSVNNKLKEYDIPINSSSAKCDKALKKCEKDAKFLIQFNNIRIR